MKPSENQSKEIRKHLGKLFRGGLGIANPIYSLALIQEKLEERSVQSFDKEDIINQLSSLQGKMLTMDKEMLSLYNLLNQL